MPPKLPPGTYTIKLIAIKDSRIIENISSTLNVRFEGLPKLISFLAFRHATMYGVVATLIAIMAGLLMGMVFRGGKGRH